MTIGIWILGDQLSLEQSALMRSSNERGKTRAIMIESLSHVGKRPYHRQKVVLLWSAMRHFRDALRNGGWRCDYYPEAESFESTLNEWVAEHSISELRVMEPNDRPFMKALSEIEMACSLKILPNSQFLWTTDEFREWASGRKRLVLEYFYREGRRRFNALMDGTDPTGGVWNYDKQNREPPREDLVPPSPVWFEPDRITQEVIEQVESLDLPLFGEVRPFQWGVTRKQARAVLEHFIKEGLSFFGPQEDAMRIGHPYMWHSLLSPYMNIGLIHPSEVLDRVQTEYERGGLELQSVEGFVRQILGWREYLRGVYHFVEDDYADSNYFQCDRAIPSFFWTGETKMRCLQEVIRQVIENGYAHHIQRLMILSNYALIAGLSPQETKEWFHATFIDAYDWVMQTNVLGMGLFADGGVLATKPYAASANYINRMSDYCKHCDFKQKKRTGENACPFNFLYWDFLIRNRKTLESLGRMGLVLSHLDKMDKQEQKEIGSHAKAWIESNTK